MAKQKAPTSGKIVVKNVRLSFERLYVSKAFQPGQDARYEATGLIDPSVAGSVVVTDKGTTKIEGAAGVKFLKETSIRLAKEANNGVLDPELKLCFGKGDKKSYDGYAGMIYIATHNKPKPEVRNRQGLLVEAGKPGAPYSGSYGNLIITLWGQNNQYGKRVNANLLGWQFVRDGEAFSGLAKVDVEDDFEAYEGDGAAEAAYGDDGDDDIPF